MKKYILVVTGEDKDDTGLLIMDGESKEEVLKKYITEHADFDLEDDMDRGIAEQMLEENPIGIAELENLPGVENPQIDWYYNLED